MRVNLPVIDLQTTPNGERSSELLFGESFAVERTEGAFSYGHAACGYQGWLRSAGLAEPRAASHFVQAMGTYVYAKPDMKSETRLRLPFMAQVKLQKFEGKFAKLPEGYVFAQHLAPIPTLPAKTPDYTAIAERFLGIPYLWGGRSNLGIDCSGLAQLVLKAASIVVPRDANPQSKVIGTALPLDAPLKRGDFVFWRSHVGVMQNADTLLHSTAHFMSVVSEPLAPMAARVVAQGDGEITAIRRV